MRHSTIKLASDTYTDLGLEDIGQTVWTLPPLAGAKVPTAAGDFEAPVSSLKSP
jgi:hypothetical protein